MKLDKLTIKVLLTIIVFNFCCLSTFYSQVSYNGAGVYGLRKIIPSYTNSAIQVVRSCDNATANIGFTSCGDLDTNALKNFVLVPNPLSALSATAAGAYSLRKLRCAYSGNAINVRRSCDNVTRDIGFTALGDLDTASLKTFVLASNPLTALSVNAAVSYGLRKLRCAYAGSAIRVRRSSDNTTADIGFTTLGDLDTAALKTFVGGGNNGFVSIWYDQSGNGVNVSPPANNNQPRIVNLGVIDRKNGMPSILFDGVDDYFTTNSFPTTGFSGITVNVLAAWTTVGTTQSSIQALIDNDHNCSKGFIVQDRPDLVNRPLSMSLINPTLCANQINDVLTTGTGVLRLIGYVNSTSSQSAYRDGNLIGSAAASVSYIIGSRFMIGAWYNGSAITRYTNGYISEVTIFKSALSNTDRQYLEWGQSQYYNISGPTLSSTLPAAAPSAFVTTWYDQSGNGRNAAQATTANQPRIINAGRIDNNSTGKPSIFFNGTYLTNNAFVLTTQPISTSCVWRANALTSPGGELFGWGKNSGLGSRYGGWFDFTSATQGRYGIEDAGAGTVGTTLNTNTWYIASQVLPNSTVSNITQWINGTAQAMSDIGSPGNLNIVSAGSEFVIGTIPTAYVQGHNGNIQELLYFSSALTTIDRQYLEYGQSVYYGINGPSVPPVLPVTPPSAYVSVWYDQSGNGFSVSQSTLANQPRIVNLGVLERDNGLPTIRFGASLQNLTSALPVTSYPVSISLLGNSSGASTKGAFVKLGGIDGLSNSTAGVAIGIGNGTYDGNGTSVIGLKEWVLWCPSSPNSNWPSNPFTSTTIQQPGGGGLTTFLNGTNIPLSNSASAVGAGITGSLYVGGYANSSARYPVVRESEVIIFPLSLNTTRRNLLETNQAAYCNITISNNKYTPPTASSYNRYVLGIGRESATDSVCASRQSAGMGFTLSTNAAAYLKDNGDYLTAGINCPITNSTNLTFLPAPITQRWDNDWYINKTDVAGTTGGTLSIYFDFVDYNVSVAPGVASNYSLLARSSTAVNFSVVPTAIPSVSGNRVYFTVDANDIANNAANNGYYTIGSKNPTASPLPVELLSFSADRCDQKVCLNWKTATETNSKRFDVERSADGLNWTKITELKAAGNSQRVLNYFAIDSEPLVGIGYYRINMIDFNETSKYSQTKAIEFKNDEQVQIYPNPSDGKIIIKNCENYNHVFIEDLSGRRVFTKEINSADVSLDLSALKGGAYFVTLKNLSTGLQFTSKIIVVKK